MQLFTITATASQTVQQRAEAFVTYANLHGLQVRMYDAEDDECTFEVQGKGHRNAFYMLRAGLVDGFSAQITCSRAQADSLCANLHPHDVDVLGEEEVARGHFEVRVRVWAGNAALYARLCWAAARADPRNVVLW